MSEDHSVESAETIPSRATTMLQHHVELHYQGFWTGLAKGLNLSPVSRIFSAAMGELFAGNSDKAMSEVMYAGMVGALVH